MERIICDTGIISRFLDINSKEYPFIAQKILSEIGVSNICITIFNKIELLNWLSNYTMLEASRRRDFKKFINSLPVMHSNENISKMAEKLINKHQNSKPADTFIGATAVYHKIPLYTLNHKDFQVFKNIILL